MKQVRILGIRGIPASHGGFETFTESLAPYLVTQGWDVTVYCQRSDPDTETIASEEFCKGVRLKYVNVLTSGPLGTIFFDWSCTLDAAKNSAGVNLVLGYNTAIFALLFRLLRRPVIFNMDGLEWQRSKWSRPIRAWFFLNERLGCWLGHHLIADNPEIERHLATRVSGQKITMIPYGAEPVAQTGSATLQSLGLEPAMYALVVARPEPENSVLDIVRAFSRRPRGYKLVVLGNYDTVKHPFSRRVVESASAEVVFPGAIFDRAKLAEIRTFARLYIHGHQVGGTNPSLVEAMAASCSLLVHGNRFNRWVAGTSASFFDNTDECAAQLDALLDSPDQLRVMGAASKARFSAMFTWDKVLPAYANLLTHWAMQPIRLARVLPSKGSADPS
jgi:glycosyltransferase involved in cell wall biosynthesis